MNHKLLAVALGLSEPWHFTAPEFNESGRKLIVHVDIRRGARSEHGDIEGVHLVHDMLTRSFRT